MTLLLELLWYPDFLEEHTDGDFRIKLMELIKRDNFDRSPDSRIAMYFDNKYQVLHDLTKINLSNL